VLESDGHEAWARVRGERWRVRSDVPLERGQHVRVKAMRGLTLDVVPDTGPMSTKGDLP
jgi:membrane-bound serine protease (ClpP class)